MARQILSTKVKRPSDFKKVYGHKNPAACPRCGKVVGVNYNKGRITMARYYKWVID